MACPDQPPLNLLTRSIDKVALELVLAQPGQDGGLLPINSLLGEIEEALPGLGLPDVFASVCGRGRRVVDEVFRRGTFDEKTLGQLRAWVEWMQEGVMAVEAGAPPPAWPDEGDAVEAGEGGAAGVGPGAGPVEPVPSATAAGDGSEEEAFFLNLACDAELLREFANESHEHLQNIELGVLTLEENPTDSATLNSIFRAFHTFKGGSGFLNLRPINRLAHELESLLDLARQGRLTIDSAVINLILAGGDTLKRFVGEIETRLSGRLGEVAIHIPIDDLLQRVRSVIAGGSAGGPDVGPAGTARPEAAEAEIHGATRTTAPAVTPAVETGPAPMAEAVRSGRGATTVKVDTQKLDALVDMVGEMVIAQSLVMQDPDLAGLESRVLSRNLGQLGRITKDLQRVAMALRMVPIRSTFQKMTRLVRDVSVKAGKHVELRMSGEETELDRTIVEEISDPLVHMIRNAVDHGIETAEARLASGKSPHGVIQLRAFHQGGNIVIEVEDDGAGLNRERILRKAVERGVVPEGAELPDNEVFNLIFAPGFSTAEKVTDLSGRGVGMDVVRRNIEKLRGRVEIGSTPGRGSRFTVFLPLTLAIIDGMIVGIGPHRYIVPTLTVRESFRPTADMISTVQGRTEVINVRGRLLPLLRLHALFGLTPRSADPTQGIVIVVESERDARGILVDDLLGKQEVVIKSLGETFKRSAALSGAAILGDGHVGLILDVEQLGASRTNAMSMAA